MLSDGRGRLAGWDWGFIAASGFVLACLVMGGGAAVGFLSDVVIQLLAIPVLLVSAWRYLDLPAAERPRWALTLAALVRGGSGPAARAAAACGLDLAAGATAVGGLVHAPERELPWAPISVAPTATWLSLVSLLPPLAVFFATLLMSFRQRRQLSACDARFRRAERLSRLEPSGGGPEQPAALLRQHQPD